MAIGNRFNAYRQRLFGRLHPVANAALDDAMSEADRLGNPRVELAHWLGAIRKLGRTTDIYPIIARFGINAAELDHDIQRAVARFPANVSSRAEVSVYLDEMLMQAWPYANLLFGSNRIRTGHLIFAMLQRPEHADLLTAVSKQFRKVAPEILADEFAELTADSDENVSSLDDAEPGLDPKAAPSADAPQQNALRKFTVDLTEKARKGEIDPIVGRDEEVRQLIDILMRRRQNNPVLVGEAGVGKTAVVEGFAHQIVAGAVPPKFKDVSILALDIGLLQAGASMKGEFEQRLRSVIDEVQQSPKPIILFIDEVHTLIGAGGAAGSGDAANLLKPALARGLLRTIAATTWDEHRKHIEKDPALSRRFQAVFVAEPDEAKAVRMLRVAASHLEKHHGVQIMDEAIESAVRLSVRFIPARQLPDKAVSLLDTASARVAISQDATPAPLEYAQRELQALEVEKKILGEETNLGANHAERLQALHAAIENKTARVAELQKKFESEKALVTQILGLRKTLRAGGKPVAALGEAQPSIDRAAVLEQLKTAQAQLALAQGDAPMLFPCVDQASVADVVSQWTGIPAGKMARENIAAALTLADTLEKRVLGQRHALDSVARRIQNSAARLENPERPVAVFMFVGPSGTGKTETALTLADTLYGGEQNLITINMAEFSQEHTVSTLKGSPPGYVGYGEGGVLTEAVRRRPYSVVLLDEVEKAHPDVHKMFFQVFDKGYMEDSEGRSINFRNTVIILTSNAAQDVIAKMCKHPEERPDAPALESALRVPLTKVFPDALLNRLVVVPYYPISADILHRIIRLNLQRIEGRIRANHRAAFAYDDSVVELIARRCGELERGARVVEALVTNSLLPQIGREVLTRALDGKALNEIQLTVQNGEFVFAFR